MTWMARDLGVLPRQDLWPPATRPEQSWSQTRGWLRGAWRAPETSARAGPAAAPCLLQAPRVPRHDAQPPPRGPMPPTGLCFWNRMTMTRGSPASASGGGARRTLNGRGPEGSGGGLGSWGPRGAPALPRRGWRGRGQPVGPGTGGCSTIRGSPRASCDGREASGSKAGPPVPGSPGTSFQPCPLLGLLGLAPATRRREPGTQENAGVSTACHIPEVPLPPAATSPSAKPQRPRWWVRPSPAASAPGFHPGASGWAGGAAGPGQAKASKCVPRAPRLQPPPAGGYFGGRPLNENRAGMLEAAHAVPEAWVWHLESGGGEQRTGERDRPGASRAAAMGESRSWGQ